MRKFDLAPKEITAALIGLKSRARVFQLQRTINNYAGEPLLAVLPGVALNELWSIVGVVENTLLVVSANDRGDRSQWYDCRRVGGPQRASA